MRLFRGLFLFFLSLFILAILGEFVAYQQDKGAFPHVNFYIPDPERGLRLSPHATEKISFSGNPVTEVRTNALGFRGADWEETTGEILVLGDSQVFGLGVEEDETASAVLAQRLGRPVRNAGVPTYGPAEYLATLSELLDRRPSAAVLVLNMSNDWFEYAHSNKERHTVWDGWAVRIEDAPTHVTEFPGRHWLYSQSHLFFAIRQVIYAHQEQPEESHPSEGTLSDLIGDAKASKESYQSLLEQHKAKVDEMMTEYTKKVAASNQKTAEMHHLEIELARALGYVDSTELSIGVKASVIGAHPGDIVEEYYGEGSRRVVVTATLLQQGTAFRKDMRAYIKKWLAAHPDEKYVEARINRLLANYVQRGEVPAPELPDEPTQSSVLEPILRDFVQRCTNAGVMPVVVTLPLDVLVSSGEWAKYGKDVVDMTGTEFLLDAARATAIRLGAKGVDPLPALRAAEPGAFLYGDIHLSPKGQAVLAQAIQEQAFSMPAEGMAQMPVSP